MTLQKSFGVLITIFGLLALVSPVAMTEDQFRVEVDFGIHTHTRYGLNEACDGKNLSVPDTATCDRYSNSDSKSTIKFDMRQSRFIFSNKRNHDIGESGVILDLYADAYPRTINRLQGYFFSNRFGLYTFGWQDSSRDSLSVLPVYHDDRDITHTYEVQNESFFGRLYGIGYAPRNLGMVAYTRGLPRFGYRSLFLNNVRWGWNYGVDSTTNTWNVDHLRHHFSASFRYQRVWSDGNELRYAVEFGGAVATRVMRRGGGVHNAPVPISGQLGIRGYLKSFRLAIAGTYNAFAVDAANGPGKCGLSVNDASTRCRGSWAVQTTFGYDPRNQPYSFFLTFHYGAAPSVAQRDRLVMARQNNTRLGASDYSLDAYYRLSAMTRFKISESVSLYLGGYYTHDNVATRPDVSYGTITYRHAILADTDAFGVVFGSRFSF